MHHPTSKTKEIGEACKQIYKFQNKFGQYHPHLSGTETYLILMYYSTIFWFTNLVL